MVVECQAAVKRDRFGLVWFGLLVGNVFVFSSHFGCAVLIAGVAMVAGRALKR